MKNKKPVLHIKRVSGTFINFYERTQDRISKASGDRRLGAEKAQQGLELESLLFAKRNTADIIEWALHYIAPPESVTKVILMSGAFKVDWEEGERIRKAWMFILSVVANLNPKPAEAIAYDLVTGVVQLQKPFMKGMSREQAVASIRKAADAALAMVAEYEQIAAETERQAKREQFMLQWGKRMKIAGASLIGLGAAIAAWALS